MAYHVAEYNGFLWVPKQATKSLETLADPQGVTPNQFDDLFAELENWEAILRALPDFDVDQGPEEDDPPDLSPS